MFPRNSDNSRTEFNFIGSPARGITKTRSITYHVGMDDFFVLPQAQKFDEVKHEIASLQRFRRALRKEDQEVLDDLLDRARSHFALASTAERLTPFEFMLLSMVIEQRKEIKRLNGITDSLSAILDTHG